MSNPSDPLATSWDGARRLAWDCVAQLAGHSVTLSQATGKILEDDVRAPQDLPHYASAAMDGWAIAGHPPWALQPAGLPLTDGQASAVVTGGLVTTGATAVLRSESGDVSGNAETSAMLMPGPGAKPGEPRPGQHIRRAGTEAARGELLIPAGTRLSPAHVALAATAGIDTVQITRRPRIRLVLTGDEVIASGLPGPGQVRDAFSPQLAGVISMLGGDVAARCRAADTLEALLAAIGRAEDLQEEVIITTGATGGSSADFLRQAILSLGGTLLVGQVAMKPGHPSLLARLPDGRVLVGLPGNPLAAMIALMTLAQPLLAKMAGLPQPTTIDLISQSKIQGTPGRTLLVPYGWVDGTASRLAHTEPAMLRGLANADGVMVVPATGVEAGGAVRALTLPWHDPLAVTSHLK